LGGGQLLRLPDNDGDEQLEQWAQPLLLRGWGIQVQAAVGPGQQLVQVQVAALGRGGHGGVAEHVQEGLGGAVDRAHGVVGAAGAGRPGIQSLLVADLHQRLGDVVDVLDIHPAGHIRHGPAGAGSGEQQHREELGAQQLPVVGVLGPMAADVGGVGQHAADPPCVGIGLAVGQGGPAGAGDAGEAEGVVDPDGPQAGPMGAGGPQDVGLDGGRDQIPLPLEDRGNDEAVGFERPRWSEGEHRVALLHGQVEAAEEAVSDAVAAAEDDPTPPWA
jgi:hypothetical protein